MADAYLKLNYNLEVDDRDMRLICLALAGQLKQAVDLKAAQELNIRLLRAQSIRIGEQAAKIDGALRKAQGTLIEQVAVQQTTLGKLLGEGD